MYNIIDLFCGSGGLSYGFNLAGYNTLLGIDNDKAAIKTFEENHKGSKGICGDITKITTEEILEAVEGQEIDIIVGGPPCQGMSLAGPRKLQDPRNKLYLSFIDKVRDIQPKAFVIENVPGMISLFKGAIKDSIIEEFEKLGYTVNYQILNAADYGVPQTRKRVFFVGLKDGERFSFPEQEILFENDWITAEQAISDLPLLESELGEDIQGYICPPQNDFQEYCRKESDVVYNHIGTNHNEQTKKIISLVPEGGNYKNLPEEYRNTRKFNVAWTRYHSKKPALTIDTGHRHHFHYKANRVPTVRENARFQSFPDHFIFYGNKTEQSRQVGNAVPPLLAKSIAEQLLQLLDKEVLIKNGGLQNTR
ncbi:DNA cytosine methyltransferase [Oceanobacillus piezotolerans]|uniref:Cytosine-specific methyltransferase n=1 Tax=Oceanobacillus piezotolerans TaxID=2448030 RepID=A0A498DGY5_9BACI|nr:DNA cytosine methyltransferase [Oceanobacillus piezotolerans]RLL43912.1 DNA cytosine methyltransferase [Oceanobacillus piezotolerans]